MKAAALKADVLVVGAGVAGLAAAIALARQGREVRVLERSADPARRPCGDGHTPNARRALQALGVWEQLRPRSLPLQGYRLSLDEGPLVHFDPGPEGSCYTLDRRQLLATLGQEAQALGVSIHRRHRARGLLLEGGRARGLLLEDPAGRRLQARAPLCLLATGAARPLGRRDPADSRRLWGARVILPTEGQLRRQEFHLFSDWLPGYLWVFPLPGQRVNVGVLLPDGRRGLGEMIATVLQPYLRQRWPRAALPQLRGAPIRVAPPQGSLPVGALHVGEAAGFSDPLSGEGIAQALSSAAILAQGVAREGLQDAGLERLSRHYPRSLARQLGPGWAGTRLASRALASATLCGVSMALARRSSLGLRLSNRLMTLPHPGGYKSWP